MTKKTILVWFRADLRIHDHPALWQAVNDADQIVPVFIADEKQLKNATASANRNRFLEECLADLRASLQKVGGDVVIRYGQAHDELLKLAKEVNASALYYTEDYTPYAKKRAAEVESRLQSAGVDTRAFAGTLMIDSPNTIKTATGSVYKVFTPFFRAWQKEARRDVVPPIRSVTLPSVDAGALPTFTAKTNKEMLSPNAAKGGETAGRKNLHQFLDLAVHDYHEGNNLLAKNATSGLSPYLHFGCLSAREIEKMLGGSEGEQAWHRQLAWRDFYKYVLHHFPHPQKEFQTRYRTMVWDESSELLRAWKDGQTGYPVVDAAMRQLKQEGWMHNRGRLIVGSFLTKDLGIDWREGEAHFMQWLLDGDIANNNGNWQWIASVGVDPAPLFRRLYNPTSQQKNYDPTGGYVRKYVPELQHVPDAYLTEPWKMPCEVQQEAGCMIGVDYPEPVVNHAEARQRTLERYADTASE